MTAKLRCVKNLDAASVRPPTPSPRVLQRLRCFFWPGDLTSYRIARQDAAELAGVYLRRGYRVIAQPPSSYAVYRDGARNPNLLISCEFAP